MSKLLTREQIDSLNDVQFEEVEVPEWGGRVRLRSITAKQRDAFEQSMIVGEGVKRRANLLNARAKLVALCLVDENGTRLYPDDKAYLLGERNAAGMDRVFSVCQRLSGLSQGDVDALAKNSEPDPSEPSASISA